MAGALSFSPRRAARVSGSVVIALIAVACGLSDDGQNPDTRGTSGSAGFNDASGGGSGASGGSGAGGASGSAGQDASAGKGGTTAGTGSADSAPDSENDAPADGVPDVAPDTSPDGPTGPNICGDGWRDPVAEECDDGDGLVTPDSCNAQCQVTDLLPLPLTPSSPQTMRKVGRGRHTIAAGDAGFAVPFLSFYDTPNTLHATFFGPTGKPLPGVVDLTNAPAGELDDPDPVVAALPGGKYAVAWTDLNGDGALRGIAMRIVDSATATAGPKIVVNTTKPGNQENADIAWTGSELVVAWSHLGGGPATSDVRIQRFTAAGAPVGGEQIVSPDKADGWASLLPFGGDIAIGWRHFTAQEQVRIQIGTQIWSTVFFTYGVPNEQPALVELDATHVLAVYSHPIVYNGVHKLFGALLDTTAPTTVALQEFEIPVLATGFESYARYEPSIARVGSRVYLAWRSKGPPQDYDELWLKELAWDSATETLDLSALEIPLPRWPEHRVGVQQRPSLAAAPLWPEGALATVWEDHDKVFGDPEAAYDFIVTFTPTPVVRLSSDGGLGK